MCLQTVSTMNRQRLKIPHFHPSLNEMCDFNSYITRVVEQSDASFVGLAKITPPPDWRPAPDGYIEKSFETILESPPVQTFTPKFGGVYVWQRSPYENISVSQFKDKCLEQQYRTPLHHSSRELETKYWNTLAQAKPIYGSDVSKSLFDESCPSFNLKKLDTILQRAMAKADLAIDGINSSYLYFGMWQTTFPWHTEDHDLYSINYLHHGAPKSWYVVPPSKGPDFEKMVAKYFPQYMNNCKGFLRHKTLVISPAVLHANDVLYAQVTQRKGDFIISLPYAYHSGFNHGFNIAEATNFATRRWINFGLFSGLSECRCNKTAVRMNIYKLFLKDKSRPDEKRKLKKFRHPITNEEVTAVELKRKFRFKSPYC